MYYFVESIGKGNQKGISKTFNTKAKAVEFAKKELKRGRGVVLDQITNTSQKTLAQKNMRITGLAKGKFGKTFTKDFGKF